MLTGASTAPPRRGREHHMQRLLLVERLRTNRGEPRHGRGSLAPRPCIRFSNRAPFVKCFSEAIPDSRCDRGLWIAVQWHQAGSLGHPFFRGSFVRRYRPSFFCSRRVMPGSTVLSAVGISRRMMGIRADRPSNVEIAVCKQPQPNTRNDRAHVPAGTSRCIRRTDTKR